MNLDLVREAGSVERYHTARTIRRQTLAEHQWGVAMVVLALYPAAPGRLLRMALAHDVPEIFTGDSPAPAKWESPTLANALLEFEEQVWDRFGFDFHETDLSDIEQDLLKFCDGVELVQWCLEEGKLGNQFAQLPARRVLDRLSDTVHGITLCPAPALALYHYLLGEYHATFG